MSKFETHYSTLDVAGPNVPAKVSDNYTCHTWIKDTARVVVCTDAGDILLTDAEGKFLAYIPESPRNNCRIESVTPAQHGLVVAGQNGWIWPYNSTTNETQYFNLQKRIGFDDDKKDQTGFENITSMALSLNEDVLYYVTRHNQLLKVPVSLDGAGKEGMPQAEAVHADFHQHAITGMDVCLRKQLIVTTSQKHIKIWNYHTKSLEISHNCNAGEEACAVAFHPSGFHIVVAYTDKIQLMNVLSSDIKEYQTIPAKNCREIKFSNGGHMFAAAIGNGSIYIYNFYTGENPSNL